MGNETYNAQRCRIRISMRTNLYTLFHYSGTMFNGPGDHPIGAGGDV